MATRGNCQTNWYNNKKGIIFEWSRQSYSIENNKSKIYFTVKGIGSDDTTWHWTGPVKIWVNNYHR